MKNNTGTKAKRTRTAAVSPDFDTTREAVYIPPSNGTASAPQFLDSGEPKAVTIRVTFPAHGKIPKHAARRFRNYEFNGEAVVIFYGKLKQGAA